MDEQGNVSDTKDSNVMYLDKDSEDREINVMFGYEFWPFMCTNSGML